MWVKKSTVQMIERENERKTDVIVEMGHERARLIEETIKQANKIAQLESLMHQTHGRNLELVAQKAKDDISIDWMRHRVNALEKQNAILLQKAAGVTLPVPEIVPTRPGTLSVPDFASMPSFEDSGDAEAIRLGLRHDDLGFLQFKEDMKGTAPADARTE